MLGNGVHLLNDYPVAYPTLLLSLQYTKSFGGCNGCGHVARHTVYRVIIAQSYFRALGDHGDYAQFNFRARPSVDFLCEHKQYVELRTMKFDTD